jgi:hypothetical protein
MSAEPFSEVSLVRSLDRYAERRLVDDYQLAFFTPGIHP